MPARKSDEVAGSFDDGGLLGCPDHGDPAAATELEQTFFAEYAECAKHGVGVHAEHGGEVAGRRESLAALGLAARDCAPDLRRDLVVQPERLVAIDLDTEHGASHSSFLRRTHDGCCSTATPTGADTG